MFKDTRSTPLAAVTVNCLLSKNEDLTTVGAALASNIARFKVTCMFSTIHSARVQRGVTALTRAVSGEKQIYSGNLEILPGVGKPGQFFGKYEIFSGH